MASDAPNAAPVAPQAASGPSPDSIAVTFAPSVSITTTAPKSVAAPAATHSEKEKGKGDAKKEEAAKLNVTEHLLSLEEIQAKFETSFNTQKPAESAGLSAAVAAKRLQENGPNSLTPPKKRHPFLKFLDLLFGLFNLMLIVSGIAAYVILAIDYANNSQNTYLGAILIFVAFMNALIEFYQQQKSQSILESFLNLIPANCVVIRDGKRQQIPAAELVLGDVVYVNMGDKVPADLLVFASTDLKVDNSSLTGEADPQERSKRQTHENPLETANLVFNGTLAVNGDGYGVVIRTGDHTVIGQIASLTAGEDRRESPLSSEIEHFVKIIASVAAVVAVVFFIIALAVKGLSVAQAINFAVGTFVSFVPEGLPATVTMLLTIAAKRMAERKVLVKDLQGVETLGAITMLATDKTGTLTRNQMTVTYVWSGLQFLSAQPVPPTLPAGLSSLVPLDLANPGPNEVMHIAGLCTRARFDRTDVPLAERQVIGDATESGLLRCAASKLEDFDTIADRFPKVFEIPFNSTNKWAMTVHKKKHSTGSLMLYIKGAPERVLALCKSIFTDSGVVPLTPEHAAKFDESYTFMAGQGHRVLAFAALALPEDQFPEDFEFTKDPINYPNKDFTFYGLVSLEDPPKHGVREAVGHCRAAGIRVMMVTGDHPLTAEAIGRKINLMVTDTKSMIAKKRGVPESEVSETDVNAIVIHGDKIDGLSDADWENIFSKEEIIFARTSPKHKLAIVKRAQARGHIVGVTGDGVNDSPALKKADLGIAMHKSGSDVSKEAAAMILLDDNFASTVAGIEEGRLIFQNLKKSVQYTITHTMPEVWANLLYIAVPLPLPLQSVQILIVDLGFELFMALSYAYDPSENKTGLMKLAPRKPVNEESVERLRRRQELDREERLRAAGKTAAETGDVDGGGEHHEEAKGLGAKLRRMGKNIGRLFTSRYWKEAFEKTDDEILVDGDVLSWAYIEVGTIQTIGCFVMYFYALWYHFSLTPSDIVKNGASWGLDGNDFTNSRTGVKFSKDDQVEALKYGQSAFYLGIMFQQMFNLFVCKARLAYPYGAYMFQNTKSFIGLFGGGLFAMAMVYIPPFNVAFGTSWRLSPLVWLIGLGFGVLIFLYSFLRIKIKRMFAPINFTGEIAGLQMYATRWSTGR
ncbi:hypothetical protein DFJ73DRAFT_135213 [Zopfochytrium polystomum]|nr:hypothetical protein DFJ73DRAFT_135213 [Zopfochytrium polystomum]